MNFFKVFLEPLIMFAKYCIRAMCLFGNYPLQLLLKRLNNDTNCAEFENNAKLQ